MKNKKIASLIIAGVVGASLTIIPIHAAEKTTQQIKVQASSTEIPEKLMEKATKLGIDITGLTREEAKAKTQEALDSKIATKAKELGIDITGLTKEEIKAKIQEASASKVTAKAQKLGVDTSGLNKEQIKAKIKELKTTNAN